LRGGEGDAAIRVPATLDRHAALRLAVTSSVWCSGLGSTAYQARRVLLRLNLRPPCIQVACSPPAGPGAYGTHRESRALTGPPGSITILDKGT
jgi:hypothetical protein